jgi:hypothetical protein
MDAGFAEFSSAIRSDIFWIRVWIKRTHTVINLGLAQLGALK